MSGTNDDYRTGSADSENSSDSYVQVNKEDAPQPEQLMDSDLPPTISEPTESDVPPVEEEEPVEEQEEEEPSTAPTDKEFDVNFIESTDPDDEETKPKEPTEPEITPPASETPPISSGVEDVPKMPETTSEPPSTTTSPKPREGVPVPSGYLRFLRHLPPLVLYVIYWRDVKLSAVVLGVILMTLLTLSLNTFIHTLVLIELSFLVVTLTYIVTKIAIDSFYNRDVANPFKNFLSDDIVFPEDKIVEWTKCVVKKLETWFNVFVKLMLFHNIKRSLKFGVCLWLLSFVTNCITMLTGLFLDVAVLFTVPVLYEKFQPIVDEKIEKALKSACELTKKVRNHIPSYVPIIGKPKVD